MARQEAQQLAKLLTYRQRSISATLGGNYPHKPMPPDRLIECSMSPDCC